MLPLFNESFAVMNEKFHFPRQSCRAKRKSQEEEKKKNPRRRQEWEQIVLSRIVAHLLHSYRDYNNLALHKEGKRDFYARKG